MNKILITGGTVFVSRFVAEYFSQGNEVFVLNRNSRTQVSGVHLIECDRNAIDERLRDIDFDVVIDVTAYTEADVKNLSEALSPKTLSDGKYILISSSAVYPESLKCPFKESDATGRNKFWRDYGVNKIAAEEFLLSKKNNAFIIRPPYLYGPMNNVYREAFVFECAEKGRDFYLPNDGSMKLQFFLYRGFVQGD